MQFNRWLMGMLVVAILGGAASAHADFALNWAPAAVSDLIGNTSQAPNANCNRGAPALNCNLDATTAPHSGSTDPDKTPFLEERVLGTDGQIYYHTIVGGLSTSSFSQETYVRAGGTVWYSSGFCTPSCRGTSSMGSDFSIGQKPLDPADKTVSGDATANPTRVEFHQINNDAELSQEVLKDTLLNKPLISETVTTSDMQLNFSVDMRGISLTDPSQTVPMLNVTTVTSAGIPTTSSTFDATLNAQFSTVTAGQYQWVPCAGVGCGPDQSGGTWVYSGSGGFNPYQVDWKAYRDPVVNATAISKGQ